MRGLVSYSFVIFWMINFSSVFYTNTNLGYVQSRVNPWQRHNYTVITTAKTQNLLSQENKK